MAVWLVFPVFPFSDIKTLDKIFLPILSSWDVAGSVVVAVAVAVAGAVAVAVAVAVWLCGWFSRFSHFPT